MIELSLTQSEAVNYDEGPLLVKASAGSGKTRVLTERIKRLLKLTRRKILAITFTNKAGEEMKDRLGENDEIKERVYLGTFHSFCQHVLENHGKHIGMEKMPHIFEDESDRLELIRQAIELTPSCAEKYISLSSKEKRNYNYQVLEFISNAKRNLFTEEGLLEHAFDNPDYILLYKEYQDILTSQNGIDFDDLIMITYNLFISNATVTALYRRMYEYICIDEAQDLNYAQYSLLNALCDKQHNNVMLVGDPNQSIFAFNGSSSDFMIKNFIDDYQPKVIELNENYRSALCIIKAAEKIIPNANNISNTVKQGKFKIHSASTEKKEAEWICKIIIRLIELKVHEDIEGEINYEKMSILARNKYVFNEIEIMLNENGIPFYYKTNQGAIQFISVGMKIFDMCLRVRLNPADVIHWKKLLSLLGISNSPDLETLAAICTEPIKKKIVQSVIELKDDGSNLKHILNGLDLFVKLNSINENEDEARMMINDISEIQTHWFNYASKTEKKSLHQFKNSMALGKTNSLSQKGGVTLSTVHTMKGQEYDIVFLMGMDDQTFPDYRAIKKGGVELQQERNNAYVAFTRARRFLFVTFPLSRIMPWGDTKIRSASRFLKDLL